MKRFCILFHGFYESMIRDSFWRISISFQNVKMCYKNNFSKGYPLCKQSDGERKYVKGNHILFKLGLTLPLQFKCNVSWLSFVKWHCLDFWSIALALWDGFIAFKVYDRNLAWVFCCPVSSRSWFHWANF